MSLSLFSLLLASHGAPAVIVTPARADEMYAVGDVVRWTVSGAPDAEPIAFHVRRNNQEEVKSGSAAAPFTIEIPGDRPEMLYFQVDRPGGRPLTFGAAVSPRELRPVAPRPRDFDRFWQGKISQLEAIPMNAVITPREIGRPDVHYAQLRLDHPDGHVYGQIAWPTSPGKHPAILMMQWASPPYPLDPSWIVGRAQQGWIILDIEPHDVLPIEDRAYYAALPDALKHYEGIGYHDRDRNYFVQMYLRDYRALDYLCSRPDWDGKTLVVTGGSMGGQQSLCVAGLHPRVTDLIVEEPAGCDLQAGLHGRQEGYPFWDVRDAEAMAVAPYIDAVNFAPRIRAACLVAMGSADNVAPPAGIWTAFNSIRGPKEAIMMPDTPHNNLATQAQQEPYYARAETWYAGLISGRVAPGALPRP